MSAFTLRLIACISMLFDHIGYSYRITVLRIVGRLAFPIFLFLIYNGYAHTSHKGRYALRLALFAVISQIPFSLFCANALWYTNGNVYFTLLFCLIGFCVSDWLRSRKFGKYFVLCPWLILFAAYFFGLIHSDYGAKAAIMGASLVLFYDKAIWKRIALVLCFTAAIFYSFGIGLLAAFKNSIAGGDFVVKLPNQWAMLQIFSLLAFLFIYLYNGKKGGPAGSQTAQKWIQYGFYMFYPVHMLILWGLRFLV